MTDETGAHATPLRFETRVVTPDDAAAVTAVLFAALDEESSAAASAPDPGRSPWVRSSEAMRRPIDVGPGRWVRAGR